MKKFIVALAAVMAMTVSINAKDNSKQCPNEGNCPKQEQCQKQDQCQKGDKKPGDSRACLFEGLNLTEEQQAQIKELPKGNKKEMLGKLKEILTPEQYVQFLENAFVAKGDGPRAHRNAPKKH